jgi:hypothetical protein
MWQKKLQHSNPEALNGAATSEAAGRGMDDRRQTLDKLRELYSHADDMVEQGSEVSRGPS